MKKLILHLPLALSAAGATSLVTPFVNAAEVTLSGITGNTCTYTGITVDASGNMIVSCNGAAPAPTPTSGPPAPTPTSGPPAPTPTAAPPANGIPAIPAGCPAFPSSARYINQLSKPPNGGTFFSGQEHYNNPSTTISDGSLNSGQTVSIPFTHTTLTSVSRATSGPGNYGVEGRMTMVVSTCPGSFDPAFYATANNYLCESIGRAPAIYFNYCGVKPNAAYYVNLKSEIPARESTAAFLFNFIQ